MIAIKQVLTDKDKRKFINYPLKLYRNNPYYVPVLYQDEKKVLNGNSAYEEVTDSVFFLAYQKNEIVGRIQGIIQKQYNEAHKEKRVRFTRFDAIDDQEVANALFQAVENWAKEKQMDTLCGPLGFSDFEREGLLIDGFDQHQTYQEQNNYPYYQKLIENYGFEKETDWVESQIRFEREADERIHSIATKVLKKFELHVIDNSQYSKKALLKKYGNAFFDTIQSCYSELYGTVPFNAKQREQIIQDIYPILDKKQIKFIADKEDNVVAVSLTFSDISDAVRKGKGHLYPISLIRLILAIKQPKYVDLGLIAVDQQYRNSGITAVIMDEMHKELKKFKKLTHLETNLNLEDNVRIRNMWKRFDSKEHKLRRCFVKKITD